MLNYPDEFSSPNPNLALLDGDRVRGGRRWVPDRYSLYRLAEQRDQLKAGVTVVRVQEDEENNLLPSTLLLVDMDNIANAAGWQVESTAAAGAGIDSFTNELGKLTIKSGANEYVADLNIPSQSVYVDSNLLDSLFTQDIIAGDVNGAFPSSFAFYYYFLSQIQRIVDATGNFVRINTSGYLWGVLPVPVRSDYVVKVSIRPFSQGKITVRYGGFVLEITQGGNYELPVTLEAGDARIDLRADNGSTFEITYFGVGRYMSGQVYGDSKFASLTRDQVLAGKNKFSAPTDIKKLLVDGNQALSYYLQGGYYGTLQVGGSGLKFIQLISDFVQIQAGYGNIKINQYGTIESDGAASFATSVVAGSLYANNLQGAGGRMVQANGSGQLVADPNAPQFDGTTFTINGGLSASGVVKAKGVDLLATIATKQPALVSFIQTSSYGSSEYYVPDLSLNQAVQLGVLEETTVFLPTLNASNVPATFWLLNPSTNRYNLFVRGQTGANSAGSEGLLLVLRPGEQARFDSVNLKRYYPFTTDAPVYIANSRRSSNYLNAPQLASGARNVTEVLSLKQYAGGLSFDFSGLLGGDSRLTLDANEDTLAFTGRFINPDGTYRQVPFQEFNNDVVNFGVPVSISKGAITSSLTINNSVEPLTNPDGGVTWVENGTLWYKGSSGTKTPLAPA